MGQIKDDEDIWKWYEILQDIDKSNMRPAEYCRKNNISYKEHNNMKYRIVYKKNNDPEMYVRMSSLARQFLGSEGLISEFSRQHNVNKRHLSEAVSHIKYLDVIERIKREKEGEVGFIKVPKSPHIPITIANTDGGQRTPITEVIAKRNDIELIISIGVKVIIAPEISSEKLIKIIELLKDL